MEQKQFKAESKRLLDLMIHSIYTHKEIFLRELISNASDAIDKLYFRSLTDDSVNMKKSDFAIEIIPDKENRTLTIKDNGIGMTKEELEEHLGKVELIEECVVLERKKDSTPVIIAIVVPNEELTEGMSDAEIYDAVKAEVEKVNHHLPTYKYIYDVEIRREKFERNTSRKIIRHKLK